MGPPSPRRRALRVHPGIDKLYLPVAHGEGKFFTDPKTLEGLEAAGCVVLRYTDEDGRAAGGRSRAIRTAR